MVTVSEMATDARVCREAESLVEAGYEVDILCLRSSIPARIRGARLIERGYGRLPRKLRLFLTTIDFFVSTVIRPADVYHAHNVPALPGCWLAARLRRSRLVYDAHEIYAISSRMPKGQTGGHTRRQHVEAAIERRLAPGADLRITASEAYGRVIADALRIPAPIAVPNYPPLPPLFAESPLRGLIGASADEVVVLYQGGFYLGSRPLDVLVRAVPLLPENYRLVLLGFGVAGEEEILAQLAKDLGVTDRVTLLPPVAHQDLARFTAGADIGVVPLTVTQDATRLVAPEQAV